MQKRSTFFIIFLLLFFPVSLFAQAETKTDSLKKQLEKSQDTLHTTVLLELAYEYKRTDIEQALVYALQAREESERIGFKHGEALAYRHLASIYYNKGDMPTAEKLALLAMEKLSVDGTATEQADVTNLLGLIYMSQGKYYQSAAYYKEALNQYIDNDDTVGVVMALHNIGVVNFYTGNYDQVARYYLNSLRLAEKIHHQRFIVQNQLNLGILFSAQKDFYKAKQYIKKSLENYRVSGDKMGEANAMAHMGTLYFNEGFMDSSLYAHQSSLGLYTEIQSEQGISQGLSNIADIYFKKKEYALAGDYFNRSITLRRKNADAYGLAISFTGLAGVKYKQGKIKEAELYYDSALVISKEIGMVSKIGEIYELISHLQADQGNYKNAYEAMNEYAALQDTLFNHEKVEVVRELEAQYHNEKMMDDLAVQKSKVKILKKSNRLFIGLVAALGTIAVLIILLGFAWYKRTRISNQKNLELAEKNRELAENRQIVLQKELERAQLEQEKILSELNFKKKELTQLALHINQQNDFLESLKNNLKTAADNSQVKSLEKELEAKINIDKQRESFEMNIDLINEEFYKKLHDQFPQLSENDKKLCAMLRLNLSSKEIAAIQNISSKSVDMNRYRLRKKLNLSNEEDIVKFLSGI